MTTDTELTSESGRRWWRNPLVWATVAILVVVATVVALLLGRQNDPGASGTGTGASAPTSPSPAVSTSPPEHAAGDYTGSGVDRLGRGYRIPTNPQGHVLAPTSPSPDRISQPLPAPTGLEWQRVDGVPMPFSSSDGPREVGADGRVAGFAHTPQGAAVGSLQIVLRLTYAPTAGREVVLATSTTGATDPIRSSLLAAENAGVAAGQTVPAAVQILPDRFTADTALVTWAFGPFPAPDTHPTSNGFAYTSVSIPMVWSDGDWKVHIDQWAVDRSENWIDAIDETGWSTWF